MIDPRITPFGDAALLVELGETFDESHARWARGLADQWQLGPAVPAYASVVMMFDPALIDPDIAEARVRELLERGPTHGASVDADPGAKARRPRVIEVPTTYDGPDLADVAARSGMTVDDVIALHTARSYSAIFLGFLPGFAYCGRLDPRIVAPRLDRPRERVPAGAVAVADGQTAVYPFASPGGWRLIGMTDLVMFDPDADEPARIRAGDQVRFVAR
ncbi:MAG TPA: 5-oxoprolinase subunit PxpB [Candidatus Limnocylindrales bacterium]|nr:5-oxoprolinase subunit PxpB [Candidatus Limnocylindrales bacterium]